MTAKVFALDTKPGVQRDGTVFDAIAYNDGRWVRFQRGRPRKMLGYREIINNLAGPSRGIYLNPKASYNDVYSGYSEGLQVLPIDNNGVGSGISDVVLSDFTVSPYNMWQFDATFDSSGGGDELLLAHPGLNLQDINNQTNTPVLASVIGSLVAAQLEDTSGTAPTGDPIEVSGGVVVLHPYVFVYGNNGLIKNCSAGNPYDWNAPDANETNVASTKIVQGLPVRGGSNAPAGLFWSLDSLIRVSYAPTQIFTGSVTEQLYWRYDIISSQSSIMSSQSVIEYDGVYYWCGVDRFLLYNGQVMEIPNTFNQNYFFDNLNYAQRQKVYASKVPRFGEIWWFYPRGDSEECNDAIVFNVREKVWYDAGEALGARRTAGYFSQVFHYPINAGSEINAEGGVNTYSITNAGSGYVNAAYFDVPLTGGTGTLATANITVAGGVVTVVTIYNRGTDYVTGDLLSAVNTNLGGSGSGFQLEVLSTMDFVSLWQHEIGTDQIQGSLATAIESYFETNDLGFVSGGPSEPTMIGVNRWLRLERVEPDFIQTGEMTLYVTGRPFAQTDDKESIAYPFSPTTGKIDMKEQRRELRIKVVSNTLGGDYQLGKMLLNADIGDVRGYG
jgi:hypothetical protein